MPRRGLAVNQTCEHTPHPPLYLQFSSVFPNEFSQKVLEFLTWTLLGLSTCSCHNYRKDADRLRDCKVPLIEDEMEINEKIL